MAKFTATPSNTYQGLTPAQLTNLLTVAGLQVSAFRPPQRGEQYLTSPGREIQRAGADKPDPRLILTPIVQQAAVAAAPDAPGTLIITAEQAYNGRVPATPEGYRKAAFRFNAPGEVVLQADGRPRPAQTRLNTPTFILEPLPQVAPAAPVPPDFWE